MREREREQTNKRTNERTNELERDAEKPTKRERHTRIDRQRARFLFIFKTNENAYREVVVRLLMSNVKHRAEQQQQRQYRRYPRSAIRMLKKFKVVAQLDDTAVVVVVIIIIIIVVFRSWFE
jgi:hypothetical protein